MRRVSVSEERRREIERAVEVVEKEEWEEKIKKIMDKGLYWFIVFLTFKFILDILVILFP